MYRMYSSARSSLIIRMLMYSLLTMRLGIQPQNDGWTLGNYVGFDVGKKKPRRPERRCRQSYTGDGALLVVDGS